MDDTGIFDSFLDNNESNLINIKSEPQSPPQYSLADSYIHLGQNVNTGNNNIGPIMTTSQSSSSLLVPKNNISQPLLSLPGSTGNSNNSNSGYITSLPPTNDTSFQHMITQSPFTQQSPLYYYNPSNSANNTPSSPMSTTGTDPSLCNDPNGMSPISSSSLMTVHHQLINHLQPTQSLFSYSTNQQQQQQPPQQNLIGSIPSSISNFRNMSLNTNNNNNNNNNNLPTTNNQHQNNQHQNNISRSMYLMPNIETNNTNVLNSLQPNFNEIVQNEQQPQQNLININSTTPDSMLSPINGLQDINSTSLASNSTTVSPIVILGDLDIIIEQQPPSDVRTRTPNDRRTFNTVIRVVGDLVKNSVGGVLVQLAYANTSTTDRPSQFILGGNKIGIIAKDGKVAFDSLSMNEASTKHRENEFCLEYVLISDDNRIYTNATGVPFIKRSRAFYAYSNQKVLSRRRNVTLRTLSSNRGSSIGGDQMHVVGAPFIRCNSLRCIFHTPHGDIPATNIELYSESVLFFTLPPYPIPNNFNAPEGTELPVQVVITNDGRNYSNPLAFTYIYEGNHGNKRLRSRF